MIELFSAMPHILLRYVSLEDTVILFDRRPELCAAGPWAALSCIVARWLLCDDSGSDNPTVPCICNANTQNPSDIDVDGAGNGQADREDSTPGVPREVRPGIFVTPGPPRPATVTVTQPLPAVTTPMPTYRVEPVLPIPPPPTNPVPAPITQEVSKVPLDDSTTQPVQATPGPTRAPVTPPPSPDPTQPPVQDRYAPVADAGLSPKPPSDTCAVAENNKYWTENESKHAGLADASRCTTSHSCDFPNTCCLAEFCLCGFFRPMFRDQECVL
jgi:hypothetical protein